MNNIINSLKRMLKNKNTVTIIGILAVVLILFFGYRYQIKRQVDPINGIPVASVNIQPRTLITSDMVETISVAPIVLQKGEVYQNSAAVIGKYSNYNTMIPKGSMFYLNTVVDLKDLPDAALVEVPEGKVPYNFPVTMDSTYGNSIYPGNYIDIYMKANTSNDRIMVGKLLENVKVLAVKDSAGKNVFENTEEARTPAYLIFGVDPKVNLLLRKASYMSNYSVELFPVPHGTSVEASDKESTVSSQTLQDFINAHSIANDEVTTTKTTTTATTTTTTN